MSDIKELFSFVVDCSTLLSPGLGPSTKQLSWTGIPQLWQLQHIGVSKAIQASLSQLHTTASLVLHAGTPLTHDWSVTFRIMWQKSLSSTILWGWHVPPPAISYLFSSFLFQRFPSLLKLFFNSCSEIGSLAGRGLALKSPLPLFYLSSGFSLNSFISLSADLSSVALPGALKLHLLCFSLIGRLLFITDLHKGGTNNHTTQPTLGRLEISSAHAVNPKVFI